MSGESVASMHADPRSDASVSDRCGVDEVDRSQPEVKAYSALESSGRIHLLGFPIDALTEAECIERILASICASRGGWVVTHNLDHLRRLVNDRAFADLCDESDIRVADGMPLVWASRLQGTPLPERVTGSSLIWSLTEAAASQDRSIFLLGGDGDTASEAANMLRSRFPSLRIAGTDPAPLGSEKNVEKFEQLKRTLKDTRPDIVYVAMGSPKQELIIRKLRDLLPGAWWMGVGISFSFVCGEVKRAPQWMQQLGLEWIHRMVQEPGRLWRRYLVEGVPFAIRLMLSAAMRRRRSSHPA